MLVSLIIVALILDEEPYIDADLRDPLVNLHDPFDVDLQVLIRVY